MDIKLPDSVLRKYLQTTASTEEIARALTLCGPSVDRLHRVDDDYVYDIEVITNRIDSASAFGIAREAATILPLLGIKAKLINSPYDIPASDLPTKQTTPLPLEIKIENQGLVKRVAAIILDNITVHDSPAEIQNALTLAGQRPLNNLVDITNYLTLCFGQPVHVFDYDKIHNAKMTLRESLIGEKVITLDNRTHLLQGGDIIIEDGDGRIIDLCGVMGGKLSEVDENTKRAVLFVQTYEPKRIRKTSLYTQERTLAAQIFEKQPDTRLVTPTLIEGVKLLAKYAQGRVVSNPVDLYFHDVPTKQIQLDLKLVNNLIGHKFDTKTVISILSGLGFITKKISPISIQVTVPSFRIHDITIWQGLAEEIARIYGYYQLKGQLPTSPHLAISTDSLLDKEYQTKNYLTNLGFTEIFNYSLVGRDIFERSQVEVDYSLTLTNPLASEFEYMRRSLTPSILMDLENNQGKTSQPIRIFELANTYLANSSQQPPNEKPTLAGAVQGLDFRTAKGYLEALFTKLNLPNTSFRPITKDAGPWQKNQTAEIYSGDHLLGIFGAIKPSVKSAFHLIGDVYLFDLDFRQIADTMNPTYHYHPISEYPDMIGDINITSNKQIGDLLQSIKSSDSLITEVIYRSSLDNKHTFTLHFNDSKRNLTQSEINQIKDRVQNL